MGQLSGYTTAKVQSTLDSVGTLVRPNLLDNWYFIGGGSQQGGGQFPINQRGQTSYTASAANQYCIDRWVMHYNARPTVALSSDGLHLSNTNDNNWVAYQIIENPQKLVGCTLTFSTLISGNATRVCLDFLVNGVEQQNYSDVAQAATGMSSVSATVPAGTTRIFCIICTGVRETHLTNAVIAAAKLEIGDTQTLAHYDGAAQEWVLNEIPNFQSELAKCQRFYQNLNIAGNTWLAVGLNTARSATRADIVLYLPVPMRTTPTVSTTGTVNLVNGSTSYATSAIAVDVFHGAIIKLNVTSSGLTVGMTVGLQVNNAGTIAFSADL